MNKVSDGLVNRDIFNEIVEVTWKYFNTMYSPYGAITDDSFKIEQELAQRGDAVGMTVVALAHAYGCFNKQKDLDKALSIAKAGAETSPTAIGFFVLGIIYALKGEDIKAVFWAVKGIKKSRTGNERTYVGSEKHIKALYLGFTCHILSELNKRIIPKKSISGAGSSAAHPVRDAAEADKDGIIKMLTRAQTAEGGMILFSLYDDDEYGRCGYCDRKTVKEEDEFIDVCTVNAVSADYKLERYELFFASGYGGENMPECLKPV